MAMILKDGTKFRYIIL